jgi:hypothetical protein
VSDFNRSSPPLGRVGGGEQNYSSSMKEKEAVDKNKLKKNKEYLIII